MDRKIMFACFLCSFLLSCDTEHNVHDAGQDAEPDPLIDPGGEDAIDVQEQQGEVDGGEDVFDEGPTPAEESCESEGGVTIEGTVFHDGDVPSASKLWVFWQEETPAIPTCSMEIAPFAFPALFRFTDVPDSGWHIEALLDVDGGFPPIPAEGDYAASIPAAELDLSGDMGGLELHLEPFVP